MAALIDRRDVDFLLHDWLKSEALMDRLTADALLDLSEKLAADQFLSHFKRSDIEEPRLEAGQVHICPAIGEALKQYAELGLFAAGFPESLGGLGLPFVLCAASFSFFAAATLATAAYPMLTVANARLITTFGSEPQIETFARPEIEGRWFGTMCLSEPQAGSSLADIRTRAVADGQDALGDRYRLVGNKMWISGGDQDVSDNIVHLVLAKIPAADGSLPEGTRGISLFIVPKTLPDGTRNDVAVAGLNHKMGYRGTANCLLNFGEERGATGWIVGEPGDGLRQMFQMMNEARISVGIGAAAAGYRAHLLSVAYASERHQGRPVGQRSGPPIAIIEHPDVRRMLLQQKCYVEGALALCLYCARLVDTAEANRDDATLLGLLTPVAKTWPSEHGLAANDLAIQIHGGYGYTRDFDVEQLWRDNRLNPIHEGTTGIQAIDLVGRKILQVGSGLLVLGERISRTIDAARAVPDLMDHSAALSAAWRSTSEAIERLREDVPSATHNATPFLQAFGHVVVGWLWLDQAFAAVSLGQAGQANRDFVAGKLRACRLFFECELPKVGALLTFVASRSNVASEAPTAIFSKGE